MSQLGRAPVVHSLIIGAALWQIAHSQEASAQSTPTARTWTSSSGSSIDATLVKWSSFDVTLKKTDTSIIAVPLDKISAADKVYLEDFGDLKERKKPEKLPWVGVSAIVKSRSNDTTYDIYGTRYDSREIKMLVDVENHSEESLDVDVIWMFFADGVSSRIKLKSISDYYPFDVEMTRMALGPKQEVSFETANARKTAIGYGQTYKGGSKIKGFVVQAYLDGWFLNGYASHPALKSIAMDGELMKELQGKATP